MILMIAPHVSAKSDKTPRVKFYNFDDMLIDGEIKKPSGLLTDVRGRANFNRLLDIKKSFLGKLEDTAREKTLK
jgi:hypothetical protein